VDVRVETLGPLRLAFIRRLGPYREAGAAFERILAWAGPRGLLGPDTLVLGLYYDDPATTPPDRLRLDACVSVGEGVAAEGEIHVQEVPRGQYVVATHRGPYEALADTYGALIRWVATGGRKPRAAPCVEIYRNDPKTTLPADLVTDVYVPLEPR
jgi:AraC family transcriptional regulator